MQECVRAAALTPTNLASLTHPMLCQPCCASMLQWALMMTAHPSGGWLTHLPHAVLCSCAVGSDDDDRQPAHLTPVSGLAPPVQWALMMTAWSSGMNSELIDAYNIVLKVGMGWMRVLMQVVGGCGVVCVLAAHGMWGGLKHWQPRLERSLRWWERAECWSTAPPQPS